MEDALTSRIRMSPQQLKAMESAAKAGNRFWNEQVWTLLLADALDRDSTGGLVGKLCPGKVALPPDTLIWFESQPLSPRKGTARATEGNSRLDLAFGHIQGGGSTQAGIDYGPHASDSWVCFVEAKCLSDTSVAISADPLRNQLTRVIENLLCFGRGDGPARLYFTLITPRRLLNEGKRSRLYGYKMEEYKRDHRLILQDIDLCKFDRRHRHTHADLEQRLDRLELTWVDFASLLERVLGTPLDLTKREWDPALRLPEILSRIEAAQSPGGS
jgi:hypothetical protein